MLTGICQQKLSAVVVKCSILTLCIDSSSALLILKMCQIYIFYLFTLCSRFLSVLEGVYIKLAAEIEDLNVTKEKKIMPPADWFCLLQSILLLLLLNFNNGTSASYKGASRR